MDYLELEEFHTSKIQGVMSPDMVLQKTEFQGDTSRTVHCFYWNIMDIIDIWTLWKYARQSSSHVPWVC